MVKNCVGTWKLILICLLAWFLTGCATHGLHQKIKDSRQTFEYDGDYSISRVHRGDIDDQPTIVVCFNSRLANTSEPGEYHVTLAKHAEGGLLSERIKRSLINAGCAVPSGFDDLAVSDILPSEHPDKLTEYWYIGRSPSCVPQNNYLGCYVLDGEVVGRRPKIVADNYLGSNFDIRYALYPVTIAFDTLVSPVYIILAVVVFTMDGIPGHP